MHDKLQQYNTRKVFNAIMENSNLSDRKIAKICEVSQPTVTRIRTYLTTTKVVKYAAIPDFDKIGWRIMSMTEHRLADSLSKLIETLGVILVWRTYPMGSKSVHYALAVHADFKAYTDFIRFTNGFPLDVARTADIKKLSFAGIDI